MWGLPSASPWIPVDRHLGENGHAWRVVTETRKAWLKNDLCFKFRGCNKTPLKERKKMKGK
jgi:hypothetical protein